MNREMNHQFMKSPAYENCQLMNASVRQILKKKKSCASQSNNSH